jgi:hypothetical protein
MSPKVKIIEGKIVRVRSLTCNISGVDRCAGALGWDYEN